MKEISLSNNLTISSLEEIATQKAKLTFPSDLAKNIQKGHDYLISHIDSGNTVYGVNTGFGPLVNNQVDRDDIRDLQKNLLQQLSGNVGPEIHPNLVRAVMTVRARALSRGISGVRPEVISALTNMVNSGITPVLQQFGSIGASGDLVPLSRIARTLCGEDKLRLPDGSIISNSPEKMRDLGLEPLILEPKEGLGLVNGTSYSAALTAHSLSVLRFLLMEIATPVSMTLQLLFRDNLQHLHEKVYQYKAHDSAVEMARRFRSLSGRDSVAKAEGDNLQPPYSSRSIVLWFGIVLEHLKDAEKLIETEINSVDDNPLIYPEDDLILHAANFQGVYAAKAADETAQAFTKLAIAMERQINRILNDKLNGDLPAFLAEEPIGLHSGIQGFQLTATSLLADIRARAVSHGTQSISTNGDNQDIVSMSANAAINTMEIAERTLTMAAIFKAVLARGLQVRPTNLSDELSSFWKKSKLMDANFSTQNLAELLENQIDQINQSSGFLSIP